MLYFSAAFLIIALLSGALAFGGIAGSGTLVAQTTFTVFLILAAVSLVIRESWRIEHKSLEFD